MSQANIQSRLRLWLRAERAFGLRFVPQPPISHEQLAPPPPPPQRPSAAPKPISPPPPPAVTPTKELPIPVPPPPQLPSGPLTTDQKRALLAEIDAQVTVCRACRLCEGRTRTVFGEGNVDAQIFFIGEGPGETEDHTGRPFVGRAGELLDKMITGMGLKRTEVYIANIIKCRPPGNRTPAPDEVAQCTPFLERQLSIIRPRVIVTLGLPAAKYMLQVNLPMGRMRGQWHSWRGVKLMPTYHPAFLLRAYTPENRAAVWSDLKQVMAEVGLKPKP